MFTRFDDENSDCRAGDDWFEIVEGLPIQQLLSFQLVVADLFRESPLLQETLLPNIRIIVQSEHFGSGNTVFKSWKAPVFIRGRRHCDGLAVKRPGELHSPIIQNMLMMLSKFRRRACTGNFSLHPE